MKDLGLIEMSELIDMLAEQTTLYTKMLSSRASREEFEECRERIRERYNRKYVPGRKIKTVQVCKIKCKEDGFQKGVFSDRI